MQPICFVIMGFGKKVDYSADKPRTLDLDATYRWIIKPAAEACNLRCIRADELNHSGIIDRPMYQLLLQADVVIADITTANPNALYELGVRHALKPYSTIIMKEAEGRFHFDLNHLATFQYRHMGDDIGASEAQERSQKLEALIRAVLAKKEPDSPVFQFLDHLRREPITDGELGDAARQVERAGESLGGTVEAAREAMAASKPAVARDHFARAAAMQRNGGRNGGAALAVRPDPFILQQQALATYKAEQPDPVTALEKAWSILSELNPETSADCETTGIAGAIQKRLWELRREGEHLDLAIALYGRGFELQRDYYNGENYALCLDHRASVQADPAEAIYDRHTSEKVRRRVRGSLEAALRDPEVTERPDYKWMLATLAHTAYALGDAAAGKAHEDRWRSLVPPPAGWELDTFQQGKDHALAVAATR
jgi:hypothetical protein